MAYYMDGANYIQSHTQFDYATFQCSWSILILTFSVFAREKISLPENMESYQ